MHTSGDRHCVWLVAMAVKKAVRDLLWRTGDRLCARAGAGSDEGVTRPWLFELGHQAGELGWRLR